MKVWTAWSEGAAGGRIIGQRHRVVLSRMILGERDPALGLDRFQAQGAVGGRAGKNHPDRPLLPIFGQRLEEKVNGATA